jgi:hypothetical protein
MKSILVMVLVLSSASALADLSKASAVQATKQKVCHIVNGKEDCTVKEAKDKAEAALGDLKKKIKK